jgi:hypothetical protein
MSIGRTILALVVAMSVALLPAAAGAGVSVKSPVQADMSAMEDMHDCCPKANPCDKAMDDCGTMATCVLQLRGHIIVDHRIPRDLCEDDNCFYRYSILVADGQSALPTSSGLTSP